MCLIVFSFDEHDNYRLVLAANRDERHDRPAAPMAFWDEQPNLLAGRDLEAGGTWFGVTREGRWAAVTNFHGAMEHVEGAPSRGELARAYLAGAGMPVDFLRRLKGTSERYKGFSLLAGDSNEVGFLSNRSDDSVSETEARRLAPGSYGLSNHLLNTPWPKVVRARGMLAEELKAPDVSVDALLRLMRDESVPAVDDAQSEKERILTPMFIPGPVYGTRSTTVLAIRRDGQVDVAERSYDSKGDEIDTRRFSFASEHG